MTRFPRPAAAALVSLLLSCILPVRAAGPRVRVSPVPGEPGVLELVLEPGPLRWLPAGNAVTPRLPGFGTMGVPGAPEVPVRRERIALGPGERLEILSVEAD